MLFDQGYTHSQRLYLLAIAVLFAMAVLVFRLYELQSNSPEMLERIRDQTTVTLRLPPARGGIYDRNGVPLAENRVSFDLDLDLEEIRRNAPRRYRNIDEKKIVRLVKEQLEPISKSLGIEIPINERDLQTHFRIRTDLPYPVLSDLSFDKISLFLEKNLGTTGIGITPRPVRRYLYGALAPHVMGYIGRPDTSEKALIINPKDKDAKIKEWEYETVGRKGIEQVMDAQLQGQPGYRMVSVDSRGAIQNEIKRVEATVGNSVFLTIDVRIQYIVETAMREFDVGRGAAVIIDTQNGDILAIASFPNYDPNAFIPSISPALWKELNTNPAAPLFNRAVSSYAPGSTFKLLVGLAALRSGTLTPDTYVDSPAFIQIGNLSFRNVRNQAWGPVNLEDALRMSINTFFYKTAIRMGLAPIVQLCDEARFGYRLNYLLPPEDPGIIPTPEWLKKYTGSEHVSDAFLANVSIGQGVVKTTPLQMAIFAAAIANGGNVYYPRLLKQVSNFEGDVIAFTPSRILSTINSIPRDFEVVRRGMRACVTAGTGTSANIPYFPIAAKTGTAQFKTRMNNQIVQDNRAWLVGYAPYDNPRYAFAVVVEGGESGGRTAGPIVRKIMEEIYKLEQGVGLTLDQMSVLPPTKGHFKGVKPVSSNISSRILRRASPAATNPPTANPSPAPPPPSPPSILPRRR
ncbi:MAG: penicillin-binding protein 2 [Methylacidiphilales bacterium]|nr:penicillin-binding protein 2 [Candidatus Methylacidiphilales bacterium]MDW8349271.1 penicillin-binding protein 2 [Verrucomicrobiae bacterium]